MGRIIPDPYLHCPVVRSVRHHDAAVKLSKVRVLARASVMKVKPRTTHWSWYDVTCSAWATYAFSSAVCTRPHGRNSARRTKAFLQEQREAHIWYAGKVLIEGQTQQTKNVLADGRPARALEVLREFVVKFDYEGRACCRPTHQSECTCHSVLLCQ